MKRLSFLVYIFSFLSLLAQPPEYVDFDKTNEDYFSANNLANTDIIEGFYDCTSTMQGRNAYRVFPPETKHETILIRQYSPGKFLIAYPNYNSSTVDAWIEKVGSGNIYNYYHKYKGTGIVNTVRFTIGIVSNNIYFEINESVPDTQLRYDNGYNYQAGMAVAISDSFVKTYPTLDMYQKVAETERKAAEVPENWTGTGFAIGNGYIVTNYHVVENAKSIKIQGVKGSFSTSFNASVVSTDKNNDIAIIKISDSQFNGFGTIPYKVKTTVCDVGEDIFVLGYPLTTTMGDEIKLTTGVISSKTGFQGDVSLYQFSAPVQPGNSGGPLFDSKGNVIGIVSSKHVGAENVGYAIKASYLNNLNESSIDITLPANNTISTLTLSEKIKRIKNYVFLITCSRNHLDNSFNSGVASSSGKTINYPSSTSTTAKNARINKVIMTTNYTAVEITDNGYSSYSINKNTYLAIGNKTYSMIRAEGISIAPDKTTSMQSGITFTLYFQPIPLNAKSMNLIETQQSEWKWYGILLK